MHLINKIGPAQAHVKSFILLFSFEKMLEFSILAIFATCIAGMIQVATSKREKLPVWERENGKIEIEKWLKGFLVKLKRTSTRTEKCRLILAVERMKFKKDVYAALWTHVQFGEENGQIFLKKISIQNMKITEFQKQLLKSNAALKNQLIGHSEIKEEKGEWNIPAELSQLEKEELDVAEAKDHQSRKHAKKSFDLCSQRREGCSDLLQQNS